MNDRQIRGISLVAIIIAVASSQGIARRPGKGGVLLYHSFDNGLEKVDHSTGPVAVTLGEGVKLRASGVYGKAAGFDAGAVDATVKLVMSQPAPAAGWTIAFWQHIDEKDVLVAPDLDLLTVLDQQGQPLLTMNKSGLVEVFAGEQSAKMECFDALYWIGGEDIHLAITYDADGAAAGLPKGKLTVYFEARLYGCVYVDLGDRRPTTIVLGGSDIASAADELYVFDTAIPMRAVYDLSRPPRKNIGTVESWLADTVEAEVARPSAVRRDGWRRLARAGQVIEAEANADPNGSVIDGEKAYSASGRKFISVGKKPLSVTVDVEEAGQYTIALRYALSRRVDTMWPVRHGEARTAWSRNYSTVTATLDGKELGITNLYPTGTYHGHGGDVDTWAWTSLTGGKKVQLSAGQHTLEIRQVQALAAPQYDAVLIATDTAPTPAQPRWVDQYRIPPAWWVADRQTGTRGGKRIDTYTIALRNRTDEPYACAIELEHDMLGKSQSASTKSKHISLAPHEEKTFKVTFTTPAKVTGSSGYLRVVLWNDDVSLPMEFRLWNLIRMEGFADQPHPALIPAPDLAMQAKFRTWLETRDPNALTPELKKWAAGPDLKQAAQEYKALQHGAKVRLEMFKKPLLGKQLDMLDIWMKISAEELDAYLPDAHAQDTGYGNNWDKVANKLTGAWHGKTFDYRTKPDIGEVWRPGGDLDVVTELTAKGYNYEALRKEKKEVVSEATWQRDKDGDVFMALRQIRWGTFLGVHYGDTVAKYPKRAGLPLLAEAYYLTGDEKYAAKAVELARALARKYTMLTKQNFSTLHREDRDWWGGRVGRYYQAEYGRGLWQLLGVRLLDLMWPALSDDDRDMIEHNYVRWGMYDATWGPLWDDPDKGAKVNREDLAPFIAYAKVAGDPAPYDGLNSYLVELNKMVLSDGIHICSTGSYGGVSSYVGFLQKLAALGVDVAKDNPSLRNAFLNHPRFIFSCGSVQPIDDGGGGQGHLQLHTGFGSPSKGQYEWAYKLYSDPLLRAMPDFIGAVGKNCRRPSVKAPKRAESMRAFYADNSFPVKKLWPTMFVAPDKGMAMLRNRAAADPTDWVEVIFDYGRFGARFHGHPCKLSILTAFNGQVGSQDYGDLTRGSPADNNSWFKGGYSHNTVQVDHRSHRGAGGPVKIGQLRETGGDEQVQWIDAESTKMFDGVYMRRTTFTTGVGVVDFYLCKSDKQHVYDWPYHNFGIATTEAKLSPADVSGQGLLRFAEDARSTTTAGLVQVTWKDTPLSKPPHKGRTSMIDEDVFVRLWSLPEDGTELLLFAGPTVTSINEEKQIDYAMLRRKASSTVFATVIEPWRATTGPKIKSVRAVPVLSTVAKGARVRFPSTEAYALEITRTDGKVQVFLVNYTGGEKTVGTVTTNANVSCWHLANDGSVVRSWRSDGAAFRDK